MSAASWFLMSRPGRPLHLVVDGTPGGRWGYLPLCAVRRGHLWSLTGPAAEKWERDRRGRLCIRCQVRLDALTRDASEFGTRAGYR